MACVIIGECFDIGEMTTTNKFVAQTVEVCALSYEAFADIVCIKSWKLFCPSVTIILLTVLMLYCIMDTCSEIDLWNENMCSMLFLHTRSPKNIETGADLTLTTIRNRAKALVTYVGRIPFRLPGDIYARLTQMHMELM